MTNQGSFWIEPGCAPRMDRDQTEAYFRELEAGYRTKGNAALGEAFAAHARSELNRHRPGPDETIIEAWEQEHGVRLPVTFRDALKIQDGGYVSGTRLLLSPLAQIKPLSEDEFARMWEDGDHSEFGDPARLLLVGGEEMLGGLLILDYNRGPEPRVLWLWRDLGDEIRDEGDGSFDQVIVRLREMMLTMERGDTGRRDGRK